MIIGLTGGIGAGKSTVGHFLKDQGAQIIEADLRVQKYLKNKKIQEEIAKVFGQEILNSKKQINKRKLAEVVFNNYSKLKKLEAILHPPVMFEIKKKISNARRKGNNKGILVVIIPLLFEKHYENLFDFVVVVTSPKNKRIQRTSQRLGIRTIDVLNRMRFQMNPKKQEALAHTVIRNNSTLTKLRENTEKLILKLKK